MTMGDTFFPVLVPLTGRFGPGVRLLSGGIRHRTAVPPRYPEPNPRGSHERRSSPRSSSSVSRQPAADGGNLIFNGSFEVGPPARALDCWTTSGNPSLRQRLDGPLRPRWRPWGPARLHRVQRRRTRLPCHGLSGRQGRRAAGSAVEADVLGEGRGAQGRRGGCRPGQHPRLGGLRARGDVHARPALGAVRVPLSVPARCTGRDRRLQGWFKSTGTLWLHDLTLAETGDKPQWYPQIGTEGVTNAIPNSNFECGTAGWGGLTFGLGGWDGNLFRLVGECEANHAKHGHQSLKINLDAATTPVYWFDYYKPVRQAGEQGHWRRTGAGSRSNRARL